jgi:hypothetical protein
MKPAKQIIPLAVGLASRAACDSDIARNRVLKMK